MVIGLGEDGPGDSIEIGEDVSGRCVIFSSLVSRAELAVGHEEIDVIAAYERLRHVDDGHGQGHFAVVVGRVLCHVTSQLGHFDLLL